MQERSSTHSINIYIYIFYTPRTEDLRLLFRDGKGSRAALKGATREQRGSNGGARGVSRERQRVVQWHSTGEPELAARYPAMAAHVQFSSYGL